jgi:tetratricopeptide (TPR) repeat protein
MLIETVLASRPRDRGALFRSAVIAHDRMILADTEDRGADALVQARKAAGRVETFLRLNDSVNPVRLDGFLRAGDTREAERSGAAALFGNIALTYVNMRLYEEAARYARRGVEMAQSVPSARDIASKALSVLANALRYQGDLEAALRTIQRARTLSEQARYASQMEHMFSLYGVLLREGRILGEQDAVNLGRPAEAVEILQKAVDLAEEAAGEDASDSASRGRVGTAAREMGDILRSRDPRRALAIYDLGIRRLGEARNSLKARRDRAELLAMSSYALRRLHRVSEAGGRIDAALAILKEAKGYPSERIRLGSPVFAVTRARADHEGDIGNPRYALEIYEELLRKIVAGQPRPYTCLPDATGLSRVYMEIAGLSRRIGRDARASALEARCLELWRHWDERLPHNGFVRRQLYALNHSAGPHGMGRTQGGQ